MAAPALRHLFEVVPISHNQYDSVAMPASMGNPAGVAYGGFTISVAVSAAYRTVNSNYCANSIVGNYLGPTQLGIKVHCFVSRVRDTRTFATRQVRVTQQQADGSHRPVMLLVVDFQVPELSRLEFSIQPSRKCPRPETLVSSEQALMGWKQGRGLSTKEVAEYRATSALKDKYFDDRFLPDSVMAQKMGGVLKSFKTSQDHLPLPEKTTADWFRARDTLQTPSEIVPALAFMMDWALSFLPLVHNNEFLDDVQVCSSLDFGLRLLASKIDLNNWHLREMRSLAAAEGHTYSEARLWDEPGNLIAVMNQLSILRYKNLAKL